MIEGTIGTGAKAAAASPPVPPAVTPRSARSRRSVALRLMTSRFHRRVKTDRHAMATGAGMAGMLALILTLLLLPKPFGFVHALAAFATLQLIAALHLALSLARPAQDRPGHDAVDGTREHVADLIWSLNEREARLRALLDGQESLIVCRDQQGRVTFVNRAFCRLLSCDGKGLIGQPLALPVVPGAVAAASESTGAGASLQQIATVLGPRWIEWREQPIVSTVGHDELLSAGRDVTAERAMLERLGAARTQAEAADLAKSRFLAAMSHEIRTPMSGILGMAGLLLGTDATPEQHTYAAAIDRSARNLLALIDEILDYSKIEAGRLRLDEAPFSLDACIGGAVELLAPRAHEKGLELAWLIDGGLPRTFVGDEARVRQILLNLIGNAIKFTDCGGVLVRVAGREGNDSQQPGETGVVISVEDTGVGIAEKDLPRLFTDFGQLERAGSGRKGGTGLGLAISRRLARAMGGEISVESKPGTGSAFRVALGLKPAPSAERTAIDVEADRTQSRRVLLAFDRAIERRAALAVLTAEGFSPLVCELAAAADMLHSAAAEGRPFDVVVFDAVIGPAPASAVIAAAHAANGDYPLDVLALIDSSTRPLLADLRARGLSGWAVRPLRPQAFARLVARGRSDDEPVVQPRRSEASRITLPGDRAIRVLLAEDDDVNALLGTCVLRKAGCLATVVRTGREAVDAVRAGLTAGDPDFDIILMDIVMPELGGIEATRAVHKLYAVRTDGPRIAPPIVALTANAFAEDRQRYLEAGLDDYLAKPFDAADLQALMCRWATRLKATVAA